MRQQWSCALAKVATILYKSCSSMVDLYHPSICGTGIHSYPFTVLNIILSFYALQYTLSHDANYLHPSWPTRHIYGYFS